jgi:hypothetical protein
MGKMLPQYILDQTLLVQLLEGTRIIICCSNSKLQVVGILKFNINQSGTISIGPQSSFIIPHGRSIIN